MEDRAKFALIGLFTFAVIAGAFGFVYWLHNNAGNREVATYRVVFEGSVSGLRTGGPVLFNGIRVGQVTAMQLTDDPSKVAAIVSVDKSTPVRVDTRVSLEYAGLTGIASVSMKGATSSSAALTGKNGQLPTLKADPNAGTDMSTAVRETLGRADQIIAENQESIRNAIKNLETFSAALARNGDKIDKLVDNSSQAMGSVNELAVNLNKQTTELSAALDKRTADISEGINKLTETANKHIDIVGKDMHRAIVNIDRSVTDLAKNPHRFIFGGGDKK
jgi:phospholipid/cholesterol/gamma-HCH transport system substrate-binding protein